MGPRDAARAAGVSTSTLRHYERVGLLPKVQRSPSGYRRYSEATVARVLVIQRALVVGFSLAEIRKVLAVRDAGGAPCQNVRAMVASRLDALERQIADLCDLRTELTAVLADWDGRLARTPRGERALLLDSLAARPAIDSRRTPRVRQAAGLPRRSSRS